MKLLSLRTKKMIFLKIIQLIMKKTVYFLALFSFFFNANAQGTVTDIDGNTYDYLTYGTQQWTVENAAMETYRDGTPIPQVTASQWPYLTTGAWCYYNNDPTKPRLYNWYAVMGIHDTDPNTPNKEFAPEGWHVPSDAEWTTLEEYLIANGYNYDGTTTGNWIAKSMASTTGWSSSTNAGAIGNNQSLNNSSGFNAFPEGNSYFDGGFYNEGLKAFFWSSTEVNAGIAWYRDLDSNYSYLTRSNFFSKQFGFSVRFVRESNTCSEASINSSATEVCAGESVDLSVNVIGNNFSNWNTNEPNNNNGDEHVGMLVENAKWNDHRASNSNPDFLMESDTNLGVLSGFNFLGAFEGHFYYQSTYNSTLTNANSTATSLGGYLLILNSQAENDFIAQTSNITVHGSWIGMYQDTNHPDYSEPGGAWFWGDGTVVSMSSNFSTACTSADLPSNLQTGLVGYWPFCGNANDESGNGNNGTVNGATLTTDRFGNADSAYLFDSSIDTHIVGSADTFPSGNAARSMSVWYNALSINSDGIGMQLMGYGGMTCGQSFNFNIENPDTPGSGNGKYEVQGHCLAFRRFTDLPTPLNNSWHNLVVTYDGSTLSFYNDGVLVYSDTGINTNTTVLSKAFVFGRTTDQSGSGPYYAPLYKGFDGTLDDIGLWNRALTPIEIQQLANSSTYTWSTGDTTANISVTPSETTEYWVDVTTNGVTCREYVTINVTAPAAPTGDSEQTFCDAATVADLTATGNNIQWYDAATGGNLLDSTTALTDGQMVYASQTVNGCESTDRLEVTVSIQDITITASATEVCAGESVDLSVVGDVNSTYLWSTGESNFSGQGTLVDEYSLVANTVSQNTFSIIPGNNYRLEVSGTINLGGGAGNQRDVAYYIQTGSDGTIEGTPFDSACNLRIWTSLFCDTPGLRPTPDIYDASTHTYNYPFTANASTLVVGFWDAPLGDNGANVVTFKLFELSNSESTITVTPTETTEYWVDVTTNGVTCREYITITVNDIPAPPISGGDITSCETLSAQNLVATASVNTGESITWYDAITGGNVVADPSLSTPGTVTYFAEATNDTSGCVGQARTAVTLTIEAAPDAPISGGDISDCETIAAQSLVATALAEAGESITWYDAPTGGSMVADPSLSTPGTVTYFAEATNDTSGCSSLSRTAVTLTITSVAAPTGEAVQSFCDNVTVSDLSANGTSLQWYDAPTGGNLLNSSYALSDGEMVYVSQTDNGCESVSRLEISVEIDVIPDPILLTTEIEFCIEAEVLLSDIEIDTQGFNLVWYDSYTFGTVLPSDTLLEDQVSYFAALVDPSSSCESLNRLEYVPSIIPCEVFIYNALSLNDNGLNDYMVIEGSEYFPENTLQIFNRDGHLVYEKDQYGTGDNLFRGIANVNGIYRSGSKMPTGSYLYVFRYFNPYQQKEFIKKGFLMINSN
jgi:uncharacterized protein (TIGR02145 family)